MQSNVNTNVERIIAKLDNDFNLDNDDWIPRVGAWVIDAMGQIDALRKVSKKIKLIVHDKIAYANCPIDSPNLIVTDCKGCVIDKLEATDCCDSTSSTGKITKLKDLTPTTVDVIYNDDPNSAPDYIIAETVNDNRNPYRYNIHNYNYGDKGLARNYVLIDNNKLELNFDTKEIYVKTEVVDTQWSNTYNCDLPIIPDVPELIEAVAFFCMYKMLTRGNKHPVFNLAASQYGTNPYFEWTKLKPIARTAVIINAQGDINRTDGGLFRSSFFITMSK